MTTPFKVVVQNGSPFTVQVEGVELLAPLLAAASDSAALAKAWATSAGEPDSTGSPGAQSAKTYAGQAEFYRDELSAAVDTLARFPVVDLTTPDAPLDAVVSSTGLYISALRPSGDPVPSTAAYLAKVYQQTAGLAPLPGVSKAVWMASVGGPTTIPKARRDSMPYWRIPLTYRVPGANRILQFAQGRSTVGDYSDTCISMKVSDDGGASYGVERVLVKSDGSWHIDNICCVYDRRSGRLEFLLTTTPVGFNEDTVTPTGAGAIVVRSFYSPNPMGALDCYDRAGTALPRGEVTRAGDGSPVAPLLVAVATDLTAEPDARDATTPYWNVGPGQTGVQVIGTDELLIAGNGTGQSGGTGAPSGTLNSNSMIGGFGFLFAFDAGAQKWAWRAKTPRGYGATEPALFQRSDGRLQIDARHTNGVGLNRTRLTQVTGDASAASWVERFYAPARVSMQCEGSVCRLSGGAGKRDVPIMLFASLAETDSTQQRHNLTVYASFDDGETVFASLLLHPDPFTTATDLFGAALAGGPVTVPGFTGYSSMTALADQQTFLLTFEGESVYPDGSAAADIRTISQVTLNIRNLLP